MSPLDVLGWLARAIGCLLIAGALWSLKER